MSFLILGDVVEVGVKLLRTEDVGESLELSYIGLRTGEEFKIRYILDFKPFILKEYFAPISGDHNNMVEKLFARTDF